MSKKAQDKKAAGVSKLQCPKTQVWLRFGLGLLELSDRLAPIVRSVMERRFLPAVIHELQTYGPYFASVGPDEPVTHATSRLIRAAVDAPARTSLSQRRQPLL